MWLVGVVNRRWVWLVGVASGWDLWVWLKCIGVVSGCCCKEVVPASINFQKLISP